MLIDTHTHTTFHEYKNDADEVVRRALENDTWLVNIGTQYATSEAAVATADRFDEGVYAAVGIHPIHLVGDITESATFDGKDYSFVTKTQTFDYEKMRRIATSSSKVVAIGETGLDYYRLGEQTVGDFRKIQEPVFRDSIRLAKELNLALVVHGRGEAERPYAIYDELISIVKEQGVARGVFHCFGGTLEQAQKIVEMGLMIGVTGIVTFKKALELQEIVKTIPIEHLVIETDAPFLAPEPYRGKRNEPSYVQYVAKKIAEIRGVSFEQVAEVTTVNARRLYII